MLVDLARSANGIVVLWRALSDIEVRAWNDDVGGVGSSGPLLAIGAC